MNGGMGIRLRKVLRDLLQNKARTLLVVLSIAVGVVGVGMIGQSLYVLQAGMKQALDKAQFSQATLATSPYDTPVLDKVRAVNGVAAAEGRVDVMARVSAAGAAGDGTPKASPGDWHNLELMALPDYTHQQLDVLFPYAGTWPPARNDVLLDWLSARYLHIAIGDEVWIEAPDGQTHRLRVAGTVRDMAHQSTTLSGVSYAYVSMDTLSALGLPEKLNSLSFTVKGDAPDTAHIQQTAGDVRAALRADGVATASTTIPEPGKHWAYDIVTSMGYILQTLGALALLLGTCLIINTIFAILGSQLRQIGIMKVLGASSGALLAMYLGMVVLFGLLGLLIGIPAGTAAARLVSNQSNTILNFDSTAIPASRAVLLAQLAIGLVVPLLAALYPVLTGIRITAREAIAGQGAGAFGASPIDRLLERVRGLPRPFLLSMRNTFRRKGRLLLTLLTLSLGGAIVVSVFSVYASMHKTLDQSLRYANFDVRIALAQPQPQDELERIAMAVPGVVKAESWALATASRVKPGGGEGVDFTLAGLPPGSDMLQPTLVAGRWLQPGDTNAVVVDSYLQGQEPDLKVGDDLTLDLGGRRTTWHIVGFARKVVGEVVCYVDRDSLAALAARPGQASLLHVVTDRHDRAAQSTAESELKTRLKAQGMSAASTMITAEFREVQEARINFMIVFLLMMASLLTIVSALGLAGSMSLNVLERTREIGIMRSIGAVDRSLWGIIVGEGALNGLISAVLGSLIAIPVSHYLCEAIGQALFQAPLDYTFPPSGVWIWLAGSIALASLASFVPAWNASRLAVRDVLAYE